MPFSTLLRRLRSQGDGFTLLELLIVVIVIGILAAIALPIFINQQKAAYDASAQSDVRNTVGQIVGWQALNRGTPELTAAGYVADGGKLTLSNYSHVGLKVEASGSYEVCGFNEKGGKYATATSSWGFDSTTGKSGPYAGVCANPVAGGGGTSSTPPVDPDVPGDPDHSGGGNTSKLSINWGMEEPTPPAGVSSSFALDGAVISTAPPARNGTHVWLLNSFSNAGDQLRLPASDFVAGKSYTFSAWVRSESGGTTSLVLSDGGSSTGVGTKTIDVDTDWRLIAQTYVAPDQPRDVVFDVHRASYYSSTQYIDDFSIQQVD